MAYNSTGSPGLATGGSGDVLTGVCAALLARKIPPYDAGRLGAWLCGRAAELAVEDLSEESMLPSDLFSSLGPLSGSCERVRHSMGQDDHCQPRLTGTYLTLDQFKYFSRRSRSSARARKRILFTAGTLVPITLAISS